MIDDETGRISEKRSLYLIVIYPTTIAWRRTAYLNPFNPSTRITYSFLKAGRVRLVVYYTRGREVDTLVDGIRAAARYSVT